MLAGNHFGHVSPPFNGREPRQALATAPRASRSLVRRTRSQWNPLTRIRCRGTFWVFDVRRDSCRNETNFRANPERIPTAGALLHALRAAVFPTLPAPSTCTFTPRSSSPAVQCGSHLQTASFACLHFKIAAMHCEKCHVPRQRERRRGGHD